MSFKFACFALLSLSLTCFLGKSYESTIPATDTGTYAYLGLDTTGHGVLPKLPMSKTSEGGHWGDSGYREMPFTFPYLSGVTQRIFGPSAWSARLLSGLFSVTCVMLTVLLGNLYYSPLHGFFAGLILLMTREFVGDGINSHLDNVMSVWILLAFIAVQLRKYAWAGVFSGVGLWFKSPVAFLLLPTWFLKCLVRREYSLLPKVIAVSVVALATGSLIWIATGGLGGWDLVSDYWVKQVWGTAVGGRGEAQARNPFLFLQILRSFYMPWSLFLIWGIFDRFQKKKMREDAFLMPGLAALILIVIVSLMKFKYGHYFMPAFPFLSIMAAIPLAQFSERFREKIYAGFFATVLVLTGFLLCTPISLSPESFPAFKRFAAYIQSYGSCADQVLYVAGAHPYGGFEDYQQLIRFYTGRQALEASCAQASARANQASVKWVLLEYSDRERCLTREVRARFPKTILFGNQVLLSAEIPATSELDLTPLLRELRAATDCHAAPLPRDRYSAYD